MLNNLSAYQKVALVVGLPVSAILLFLLFRKQDEDEELYATTSRKAVIEVNVPKDAMSAVIGRQGFNIKQIQETTKTRIHFKDNTERSEFRVAIIKGKEFNEVQEAQRLILKTISDAEDIRTEEILVPPKSCGYLIGRNGETIRSMCRESRAKILINSNSEEDRDKNGYVKVLLKGTEDQIQVAKALIEEKLALEEAFRRKLELTAAKHRLRKSKSPVLDNDDKSSDQEIEANISLEKLVPDHTDGYLEVYISSVDNVGHFWVQIVGSKAIHLDRLVEDMTSYYSKANYPKKFHEVTSVNIGDIVAAPFTTDDSWYRVRVIEISGNQATVFYVDFGDSETLKLAHLQTLRPDFLTLPFQAIECYLANVIPINDDWSEEANILFEQLSLASQWKVIMSRTVSYKDTIPVVELVNTNGEKDIYINKELVEKGHAIWQSISIGDSSSASSDSSVDIKIPEIFSRPVIHDDVITKAAQLSQSFNSQNVDIQHLPKERSFPNVIRHLPQETHFQSADIRQQKKKQRSKEKRLPYCEVEEHLPKEINVLCHDIKHLPEETSLKRVSTNLQKRPSFPNVGIENFLKETTASGGDINHLSTETNTSSGDIEHLPEETSFKSVMNIKKKSNFDVEPSISKETSVPRSDIEHLSKEIGLPSFDIQHLKKENDHRLLVSSPILSQNDDFFSATSSTPYTISTQHSDESGLSYDNGYSSSIHTNDSLIEEKFFNDIKHEVQEKSVTANSRLSCADDSLEVGKSALSESTLYNQTIDSSEIDSSMKELSSTSSLSSKSFLYFHDDKASSADNIKSSFLFEKDEYSSNSS